MGLNSDKSSKVFFALILAVFLPNFIFFVPQWFIRSTSRRRTAKRSMRGYR